VKTIERFVQIVCLHALTRTFPKITDDGGI